MATHPPAALIDVVANGDVAALTMVPGIGKKRAERLLVELKDRLSIPILDGVEASGGNVSAIADVRDALVGLGYGTEEIHDVLRDIAADSDSETLLRDALKSLSARRA